MPVIFDDEIAPPKGIIWDDEIPASAALKQTRATLPLIPGDEVPPSDDQAILDQEERERQTEARYTPPIFEPPIQTVIPKSEINAPEPKPSITQGIQVPSDVLKAGIELVAPGAKLWSRTPMGQGAIESASEQLSGLTSPESLKMLPVLATPVLGEGVGLGMAAQGLNEARKKFTEAWRTGDQKQMGAAILDAAGAATMIIPAAHGVMRRIPPKPAMPRPLPTEATPPPIPEGVALPEVPVEPSTTGEINARNIASPTRVLEPEVRPPMGQETPLRQSGEVAGTRPIGAGTEKAGGGQLPPEAQRPLTAAQAPLANVESPSGVATPGGAAEVKTERAVSAGAEKLPAAPESNLPTEPTGVAGTEVNENRPTPGAEAQPTAQATPEPGVPVKAIVPGMYVRWTPNNENAMKIWGPQEGYVYYDQRKQAQNKSGRPTLQLIGKDGVPTSVVWLDDGTIEILESGSKKTLDETLKGVWENYYKHLDEFFKGKWNWKGSGPGSTYEQYKSRIRPKSSTDEAVKAAILNARTNGPSPEFRSLFGGIDPDLLGTTPDAVRQYAESLGLVYREVKKASEAVAQELIETNAEPVAKPAAAEAKPVGGGVRPLSESQKSELKSIGLDASSIDEISKGAPLESVVRNRLGVFYKEEGVKAHWAAMEMAVKQAVNHIETILDSRKLSPEVKAMSVARRDALAVPERDKIYEAIMSAQTPEDFARASTLIDESKYLEFQDVDLLRQQLAGVREMVSKQSSTVKKPVGGEAATAKEPWYSQGGETSKESIFKAMRAIQDRVDAAGERERKLRPPQGSIAAGAAGFDEFIRSESQAEVLRAIRKGATPEEAEATAKQYAREAVAKHNAKRPKDINWARDSGTADTTIERAVSELREASKPAATQKGAIESQTVTRSADELKKLIGRARAAAKISDPRKKKGKEARARLSALEEELKSVQSAPSTATPTYWSRESPETDIRKVRPTGAADSGERVRLANGQVWEYRGVSGYKVDNLNRVNGWERVSQPTPKPTPAPEPTAQRAQPEESRVSGKSKQADIFGMEEGDLRDLLEERFGEATASKGELKAGRTGTYTFPSYDAFKDWMNARYAERDLDGMKLAFAEAPTDNKVRFIKEVGKEGNAHKKAWVYNMATGAPLPVENPPITRTTPRPTPTGATPAGPSTPAGPPPPPRTPTPYRKFDITALTQLLRQFGKFPGINEKLRSAYGRYLKDKEIVELKARLLWDQKLAERVLGHEIGHYIDLAISIPGLGRQFAERLAPLRDFQNEIWKKAQLRNDARALSRDWRGPFANGDSYRDTAKELMADFLSAMFNKPEWVNQQYPRLHDAFSDFRHGKTQFDNAYRQLESWLRGDTMVDELRKQDKEAVNRTIDILTEDKKKVRSTLSDRLTFDLMSLWNRAFEKEGKPRAIGKSITEKLEGSYLWAAKRLSLWYDDFLKSVQTPLDSVYDDPVQARTDLLSYSKAQRTIGEVRAAGVWMQAHPGEVRDMLNHILDLPGMDAVRSKFKTQLDASPDAGLYDLWGAIAREIFDHGDKFAERIQREISDLDYFDVQGRDAMMAFNVRGKLLNPGGLTPENAQHLIDKMKAELGPAKFTALDRATQNLRDLLYDVQSEMHDAGLISDKTWKEIIEPNRDNYVPYAVLDYFDGKVRAGVMPQKGTAKDVADIAAATQLKVASAYSWLQKQRQVQLLRDAYAAGGSPVEIGRELKRASDLQAIQKQHVNDDVSRAAIWKDGKPHLVEFPGDPGKLLQDALSIPEFYDHIEWMHLASNVTHRLMQVFTQLSPRFLLYRNIVRGFRTAGLKVGFGAAAKQLGGANLRRNLELARNYANAAFGGEMLPEVRQLVESEALPPPRVAAGSVRDLPDLREQMVRGSLPVFTAQRMRGIVPEKSGPISDKARQWMNVTDKVFTGYEAFEKIYNYQAAISKGYTPETAAGIAKRGGIPRPGVSGKWSPMVEIVFPWTRVRMQGMRASYDMMRDPQMRRGFMARFALTEALPRLAKVAIGTGIAAKAISWLTHKNEDEADPVISEAYKRVSPYKMALDDVVPMWFYDSRTGKVHYFWEFNRGSEVPKHFEVVSLRIPASEEGQTFGTVLYNSMTSLPGISEKLGAPSADILKNLGSSVEDYVGPQLNPMLTLGKNLNEMIVRKHNPEDSFRNKPAANPQLFDAGGKERAEAIAGYTLNQLGGPGELAGVLAANMGLLDERALNSLKNRISTDKRSWSEKIPFIGTAVSHDNYGQYREEKSEKLDQQQERARARLVMSNDVRDLYDFYYRNLNRQDKMTESEKAQFIPARIFVERIWGSSKKEGTFYNAAMNAASKDGSRQARETVKRDMDQASQEVIQMFRGFRNTK